MFQEGCNLENKELPESVRMKNILEELEIFSKMDSASGKEENIRNFLIEKIKNLGMETHVDEKGNLWVPSDYEKEGDFLLTAHMDKVGEGSELRQKDEMIEGRLDNAVSLAIIMALFKEGYRPSVLFTVEEEAETQTIENGKNKYAPRDLPDNIYNAGARHATVEMPNILKNKPKLTINLDVSFVGESGVCIYKSSMDFHFPKGPLKDINKILREKGISCNYVDGLANDSIEFSFNEEMGVISMGPHIENPHTPDEKALIEDVLNTANAVAFILEEYEIINKPETPIHMEGFEERKKAIILPDKMPE